MSTAQIPVITVSQDLDSGDWELWAKSYGQTMPVGPRLFRAPPHPAIQFQHTTEAAALKDAATLRAYLDRATQGPKKAKGREEAEVAPQPEPEAVDISGAWWKT